MRKSENKITVENLKDLIVIFSPILFCIVAFVTLQDRVTTYTNTTERIEQKLDTVIKTNHDLHTRVTVLEDRDRHKVKYVK